MTTILRKLSMVILLASVITVRLVSAQDEAPEFLPGLVGHYHCPSGVWKQVDEVPQYLPEDSPADSLAEQSSLTQIVWQGWLHIRDKGPITFHAFVAGELTVEIDGESSWSAAADTPAWVSSQPLQLGVGRLPFRIQYRPATREPQLLLFWSAPGFVREPIAGRYFWHAWEQTISPWLQHAPQLVHGLRCAACHHIDRGLPPVPGPDLTHLQGNIERDWLIQHLMATPQDYPAAGTGREADLLMQRLANRRMPFLGLSPEEAHLVADALLAASLPSSPAPDPRAEIQRRNASRKSSQPRRDQPDAHSGAVLFHSIGCLACHPSPDPKLADATGSDRSIVDALFGGGDLSRVLRKRPEAFLARWLADPAMVNKVHRMPAFELDAVQRMDLIGYLSQISAGAGRTPGTGEGQRGEGKSDDSFASGRLRQPAADSLTPTAWSEARRLVRKHRCNNCHLLPDSLASAPQGLLPLTSPIEDTTDSCLGRPDAERGRPGYELPEALRNAMNAYLEVTVRGGLLPGGSALAAATRLTELNCLGCHARGTNPGIAPRLPPVAEAFPETAARLAAMAPPALHGIGDKLTEEALKDAITRRHPPLRPWLDMQMPKYSLQADRLQSLVDYFVDADRIPDYDRAEAKLPEGREVALAAPRLVTADGFGCQSCHQIGSSPPPQVDLKARGTDLTMLGQRIRKEWFDRWVRNPSRIIPQMEMPAIQTPVAGVLGGNLDVQLESLWQVLNQPGFEPPKPNPVRIVRAHNDPQHREVAQLVTGVLEVDEQTKYVWPLAVGMPNRHNVLFDLESGRLVAWWLGDVARQYTRGKTWYWEPGSPFLSPSPLEVYRLRRP